MNVVVVENLRKEFDSLVAVDSISFTIQEGEIFGFLGPNGAGKTTTLDMLSTLATPTSGKALVNNFDVRTQQSDVRKSIGVVFQDSTLDDELTAYENMDFHGRLYGMSKKTRRERIDELLNMVELNQRKKDLVKTFSGGMKRRLEIARGLLHEPGILFLDEPTLGLDPQTRNRLWDYIKELNRQKNVSIILTTHYMDEANALSDRVAIIDQGKIIASGTPDELKRGIGGNIIRINSSELEKSRKKLVDIEWIMNVEQHNEHLDISVENPEKRVPELVGMLQSAEIPVDALMIQTPTLEDVFLHFTGKTIREREAGAKDRLRMRKKRSGR